MVLLLDCPKIYCDPQLCHRIILQEEFGIEGKSNLPIQLIHASGSTILRIVIDFKTQLIIFILYGEQSAFWIRVN